MISESAFSFIIPVLNGEAYMRLCLEHIEAEMSDRDELIVIDNGSVDNTISIVEEFTRVKLLKYPNVTISALRNRAASTATNDILAFIDSDCLVCSGWRVAAVKVLSDTKINVTGSVYDLPEKPTWVEKAWYSRKSTVRPINYLASGNLVIRKGLFDKMKGFDESLATDEDSEFCLRLKQKGHLILNDPAIRVIHLGNAKTIGEFYRKIEWQATSICQTMFTHGLDKPMAMTLFFILTWLFSLTALAASTLIEIPLAVILAPLFIAPLITVIFRTWQQGSYRYSLPLLVLYLIYYLARSSMVIKTLTGYLSFKKGRT